MVYYAKEWSIVFAGDALMSAWFAVYPLMNILTIFPFYFIIRKIINKKQVQMRKDDITHL